MPLHSIDLDHWSFWWTGQTASTSEHVTRFRDWSTNADHAPLNALAEAAEALFDCLDAGTLHHYSECLYALDAAAKLGIYSADHNELRQLAKAHQVVYKPCGAGGGDVGAAYCADAATHAAFAHAARHQGYLQLDLTRSANGVYQSR